MRNDPLDLNNFPDDNFTSRDNGKQQLHDDSSSSASGGGILYRKKKNGGKQLEDESAGKVYECRFCSLKFCKSQALGGHMNRHRQERETETLNRARQLVFTNDIQLPQQLGGQPVVHRGFHHEHHQAAAAGCTRLFSGTNSTTILPHGPPSHNVYTTTHHHVPPPPVSRVNNNPYYPPINDYFVGHVCSNSNPVPPFSLHSLNTTTTPPPPESGNNYTCIGAPVGVGQTSFTLAGGATVREMSSSSPVVNRCHQDHGF